MKPARLALPLLLIMIMASCGPKEKNITSRILKKEPAAAPVILPLDKGFSEYIAGYTSGIIPVNSAIEIRFTPEFAAKAKKDVLSGLFTFDPSIKGKTEWKDETTLVFTPSRFLDAGKSYTGGLDLSKLGVVTDRLISFPIRFQTLKKDFSVTTGTLECPPSETDIYILNGDITTSDVISNAEVES